MLRVLLAALLVVVSLAGTNVPAQAGTGDNYPSHWKSAPMGSVIDSWGYYNRNCTSWTAWALSDRNGFQMPRAIGDAANWGPWASARGYAVNMTPAKGSVAWWSNNHPGTTNHVAWVEAVNGDQVTIEEYNYGFTGNYNRRVINRTSVSGYIHFKDIASSPSPAIPDTDGDQTPDTTDLLPYIAGASNNRGVPVKYTHQSGDFNGDGKKDILAIYNYDNGHTRFWMFYGQGSGNFNAPQVVWDSGPGNWEWKRTKPVIGDFNGDGKTDLAALYDYDNAQVRLWMFLGTPTGFAQPTQQWDSGPGNWEWKRTSPHVGDFNGDGYQDIVQAYDYDGGRTKFWMFYGQGSGNFNAPQVVWDSGPGNWEWKRSKFVTGDFNADNKTDFAAFYDYDGGHTRLWIFPGSSAGFAAPAVRWDSGPGNWEWKRTIPFVGDFNGDGSQDIVHMYDYDYGLTKLWAFYGQGNGSFNAPQVAWDSGFSNWEWRRTKPLSGDFNGDGKVDIAALYDYDNAQVRMWMFPGTSTGFAVPARGWDSGPGNWELHRVLMP